MIKALSLSGLQLVVQATETLDFTIQHCVLDLL